MIVIEAPTRTRPLFVVKAALAGTLAALAAIGGAAGAYVLAANAGEPPPFVRREPGKPLYALDGEAWCVRCWGTQNAVYCQGDDAYVLDLVTREKRPLVAIGLGKIRAMEVSGDRIALGDARGAVLVVESEHDNGRYFELSGGGVGERAVRSLAFSVDGKLLAAVNERGNAAVWSLGAKQSATSFRTPPNTRLAFGPDLTLLVAAENEPLEQTTLEGSLIHAAGETDGHVLTFARHDNVVATGGCCGRDTIQIWERFQSRLRETSRLEGHKGPITALRFRPDGTLVSGSKDQTIRVWDPVHGTQLRSMREGRGPWGQAQVLSLDVSPDGTKAIVAGQSKFLEVWDLEDAREITDR